MGIYLSSNGKLNIRDNSKRLCLIPDKHYIDLYQECNVINGSDSFIWFQVYMKIIIILTYETDLQQIKCTEDLLDKIHDNRGT